MTFHLCNATFARSRSACRRALVVLAALAVGGCATVKPEPPELQVRQLATQRWQALLAGDFDKAYAMSTPAYRLIHAPEAYKAKKQATPVKWLAAEVFRVECQETSCVATIKIQSKPVLPIAFKGVIESGIDETWVNENGHWWMHEAL